MPDDLDIARLHRVLNGIAGPYPYMATACAEIGAGLDAMEAELKTVLDREAETHRRHDEKVEGLEARVAELGGLLQWISHRTSYDDDPELRDAVDAALEKEKKT